MMLEQRTKGYLYLVVGALLVAVTLPSIISLIIFVLGIALVGYGAALVMSMAGIRSR